VFAVSAVQSHTSVSSAYSALSTRTAQSRLTCNKQYNICRRTYSLFAANSLESRSLYTYCAKSYSESRYSSFHVTSSASKHLALLIPAAHNPALVPCPLTHVDVRLCCAASSMNDRSTSSMSSCVPRSGVTMLSSSVRQTSSAMFSQLKLAF
jgi:hypothetical protein